MAIAGNRLERPAPDKLAASSECPMVTKRKCSVSALAVADAKLARHVLRNVQSVHRYGAAQVIA